MKYFAHVAVFLAFASAAQAVPVRFDVDREIDVGSGTYYRTPFNLDGDDASGVDFSRSNPTPIEQTGVDLVFNADLDGSWIYGYGGTAGHLSVDGRDGLLILDSGPLAAGDVIQDGLASWTSGVTLRYYLYRNYDTGPTYTYSGAWATGGPDDVTGYLAFKLADGRLGWMHLATTYSGHGTVLSYGYETDPGTSIVAGAASEIAVVATPLPASAPLLVIGGLAFWTIHRRRKAAQA